ncbi:MULTISPECIES: FAD-binding oxidoreductase [Pseudomonas]|uniref:D-lactate dehydrogenase (cytochrome) n=2 Tax=Pseudomonas fluorescens TaxID=294 RepID=C3KC25_PSEFS|nr:MULTISPECIES: FAD-linked oxidase C-terminal domain-containing protein [Pseudomonas]MBZ6454222.1 FAD-binding protein [Pseudomonas fluorescens group sp.]MBZ6460208.1 FAD-binding protein [Pseudomonas fluorescens group sp.]MBZ6465849.1 FAD-binding protein [Pseudomonas fluorescens group sp.]PLR61533.1 FAD-binding protein [Pseudomonas sp. QC2]WQD69569.1 FAD-linked oxidase C-terminal domain-containing protein [Pseudomonas marginalis]
MTQLAQAFTPQVLREAPAELIEALAARFDERCSTATAIREQHGRDESAYVDAPLPQAVVFARSTEDIVDTVRLVAAHRVPLIAYGAGSSVEGHLLAVQGGISLDLSQMNQILAIHTEDMSVTVQPGVTRRQLEEALKSTGLFFPIDPGADASIGGMCATSASGTNAVRYGTMKENVLALQVVTAGGDVIRTGTRAKKSSAGYDLTHLMVGSEGTLGIISEITLRLHPVPESICAAVCSFDSIDQAVNVAIQVIQSGIAVARIELIDANTVRMVNVHSKLELPETPMLLMEFHGSELGVREQAQAVQEIAGEWGGQAFEWATSVEARRRLWTARHHAYFAAIQSQPGCRAISTDTCVPISRLAECLLESIAEVDATGLPYFLVGHVGDGNFHFGYLIDPDDPQQRALAESLNDRLVARAIRLAGTCTGEHGIGLHKQGYLVDQAGAGAVEMMRAIKRTLDPDNILNPGKIFSFDTPAREARP